MIKYNTITRIPHQTVIELYAPVTLIIIWKDNALCPAMFNPLYSSTNKQLFKNNFYNQSSPYESCGQFPLQMEAIMCLPQNQHFM